ncbi:hypothetical protein STEG23_037537, partial [Scotinomys teguina]
MYNPIKININQDLLGPVLYPNPNNYNPNPNKSNNPNNHKPNPSPNNHYPNNHNPNPNNSNSNNPNPDPNQSERFAFLAEWYDPNASLLRRYELLFYPADGSVEMHDLKNRRTFLKRTKYEDLRLDDLFIGNKVNVFSRQLVLVDYGDQYTARQLGSRKEKTLALIKPDAISKAGEIIEMINKSGFTITKLRMMMLSRKEATDFHADHHSRPFYNELIQFITSGPVIAMEILRDDAICEWKRLLGLANSGQARTDAPGSIRALFGTDGVRNAAHGPDSFASAAREMELFFPSSGGCGPANTAKFTNCTCCIIKPHAISEGSHSTQAGLKHSVAADDLKFLILLSTESVDLM